jgi:hypothetical protein
VWKKFLGSSDQPGNTYTNHYTFKDWWIDDDDDDNDDEGDNNNNNHYLKHVGMCVRKCT